MEIFTPAAIVANGPSWDPASRIPWSVFGQKIFFFQLCGLKKWQATPHFLLVNLGHTMRHGIANM